MSKLIAVGCDHGGFDLKADIAGLLSELGYEVIDCGCFSSASVDYPDIAKLLCDKINSGECDKGILICGTGIGMSIAANKINGIRCAHCTDTYSAAMAKQHNNANVIAIGARITGSELAKCIVKSWLESEFLGGRHAARVDKIMQLED